MTPTEAEQRETIGAIEVIFDAPVHLSSEHQSKLIDLLDEICAGYEANHTDRVMWAAGIGQKMLTNPFMVDDEHPMRFDESVFFVECCERERYEGERAMTPTNAELATDEERRRAITEWWERQALRDFIARRRARAITEGQSDDPD